MATSDRPWVKFYDGYGPDNEVPDLTLYEWFRQTAGQYPDNIAIVYQNIRMTYRQLIREVDACASALMGLGIRAGDSVMVSLPNIPNVLILFFAINRLGARAVMTHPLATAEELKDFATQTNSHWVFGIDMFMRSVLPLLDLPDMHQVVICGADDYLGLATTIGYRLTKGRGVAKVPTNHPGVMSWRRLMAGSVPLTSYKRMIDPMDGAVVLFTGGTTDLPKGIEHSAHTFNALVVSIALVLGIVPENSTLAILPAFHGYGLGLCMYGTLVVGATVLLEPEVGTKPFMNALLKHKPSYIAGVPTLYQALLKLDNLDKVDFSQLRGAYSGGDTLTPDLKRRFDEVLMSHGSHVELEEGYGLTECVAVVVSPPVGQYRPGSIGVPSPGVLATIVKPGTIEELPTGSEGEICLQTEQTMIRYINDEEATAKALRRHDDGLTWLHTGDVGSMDEDGFIYFTGRIKRLVKVSGVAVFPAQVDKVLEDHPSVKEACSIGVPDEYQMSSIKAFIALADGVQPSEALKAELRAFAKARLMTWSVPRTIEFRDALPHTKYGKVAYKDLEEEEAARRQHLIEQQAFDVLSTEGGGE